MSKLKKKLKRIAKKKQLGDFIILNMGEATMYAQYGEANGDCSNDRCSTSTNKTCANDRCLTPNMNNTGCTNTKCDRP